MKINANEAQCMSKIGFLTEKFRMKKQSTNIIALFQNRGIEEVPQEMEVLSSKESSEDEPEYDKIDRRITRDSYFTVPKAVSNHQLKENCHW